MLTAVVLQPSYLPWIGYFDQIIRSDVFVFYDDVQYDRRSWRNRNRIRTKDGFGWLSVPVVQKGRFDQEIKDVRIDNTHNWKKKHIEAIRHSYGKARHFSLFAEIEPVIARDWEFLVDLDVALVRKFCDILGIKSDFRFSSEIGASGDKNRRLVDICRELGAGRYLTGDSAEDYLDIAGFAAEGIEVEFQRYRHPVYNQVFEPFMPYMSALDLVMNEGAGLVSIITGGERV